MKRKWLAVGFASMGVCLAVGLGVGLGVDWDKTDEGAIDEEVSPTPWEDSFRKVPEVQ